ncbi:hypothetical protein TanjilG_03055 [Lupinus angustifolius]|uniref:Uncharacterized protein n=1 Tax=Lupinus angustifolius TaxID=3871 RepID=A0A4P1RCT9_LUPAN|nr:hypothetical protein TanjilG_03055 [Lupinus angustifolius]
MRAVSPQGEAVEELDSTLLKNDDPLVADLYPFEASRTITQTQPLQEHEGGTIQTSEFDHVLKNLSFSSSQVKSVLPSMPQGVPAFVVLPLYLVLVTNLTVVFAKLLSTKNIRRYAISSGGDQGDAQLVRALEFGLVLQNVVDAFFMDCSVYAIVVVCGLSLVQR